jgi:hypothetical protein
MISRADGRYDLAWPDGTPVDQPIAADPAWLPQPSTTPQALWDGDELDVIDTTATLRMVEGVSRWKQTAA